MLGKLKRTLTKNISEQRRTSDEKGESLLTVVLSFRSQKMMAHWVFPIGVFAFAECCC